jgi:hypothetical protein
VAVAVDGARRLEVVGLAEDAAVVDGVCATPSPRDDVVHLEADRGATDAAVVGGPLAAAAIPFPHGPLHLRRDRRPSLLLLREEQVERRVEDLLVGRTRLHVRLSRLRPLQLVEQVRRDREVEAPQVRGQRFDGGPGRVDGQGRLQFAWANPYRRCTGRRRRRGAVPEGHHRNRGHRRPSLRHRHRRDLGGDLPGLLLGAVEEAGQDLRPVRLGHDLRELDDARDAEATVAKGCDDLGEPFDQPRRNLPVMGGRTGEA